MAKFKLRGPDGGTYAITADTPEAAHAALYGTQTETAPKSDAPAPPPQDNQKQTEDLPLATKALKALAFGATQTRSKDVDTLRKSGAVGFDLDKLDKTTDWMKQQAGLQNYDPASAHFADSSKPWTERIGYLPRTLLEGAPEMAQHIAASTVGGPLGMLASTAVAEGGSSVNRVREADKTDPNAELTTSQKMRVGGNVLTQAILNEVGGRATLGATQPVKAVGMEGVKQAAGNVVKAAGVDAAVGGYGAGADKALIEGQVPSVADVALPSLAGATVGTAFRAPGAAREAAVATRFRELGKIDPQSRGEVADILKKYDGSFDAAKEHLGKELDYASKGLDDVTKASITEAKIKLKNGQRLEPEEIQAVAKADPEAGKVLQNLDTFSVMKGLDNGGLSGSAFGRLLNPFQRGAHGDVPTTLGRFAEGASIGHAFWAHDPTTAAAVLGTQLGGTMALKGVDALTGAANPARVITDKFAGTAEPTPSIAEARAATFAKSLAERQAKAEEAKAALYKANSEKVEADKKAADIKLAEKKAKEEARATVAAMRVARQSLDAVRNTDAIRERQNQQIVTDFQKKANDGLSLLDDHEKADAKTAADKQKADDAAMRRQADLMRNSQAVEERRLAAEDAAKKKFEKDFWANQRGRLDLRTRSDIPVSEALGRNLGDSQNVPLPELVSSDASKAIRTQAGVQRILSKAEKDYWAAQREYLALRNKSDDPASEYMGQDLGESQNVPLPGLVSTSAALPLALSRMKNPNAAKELRSSFQDKEEATQAGDANSSPLSARPDEVKAAMALNKSKKKAKQKQEQQSTEDTKASIISAQAKADRRVSEARREARQAEQEADDNYHVFTRHGVTERYHKDSVKNPQRYEQSWNERQDTRKFFLDDAREFLNTTKDRKTLDGMLQRWSKLRNKPEFARKKWDEFVDNASLSPDTKQALKEGFDDIMWTWETTSNDE
jgi:hypothetical protein